MHIDTSYLIAAGVVVVAYLVWRLTRRAASQVVGMPLESRPISAKPVVHDAATQAEIMALIRQDQKISAIKVYRDRYGCDLRSAKEAVEAMEAGHVVPTDKTDADTLADARDILRTQIAALKAAGQDTAMIAALEAAEQKLNQPGATTITTVQTHIVSGNAPR